VRFQKQPTEVEAFQWFENGDHPQDGDPTTEGEIVRYFRRPDIHGNAICKQCGREHNDHGWIDTLEDGHRVCPGDWIIQGVKGELYPCKPDIFSMTYERVIPDEPASDAGFHS
jgi:hypothetical protein